MKGFIRQFLSSGHIAGVIFDVDGTILDSMPVWSHSGERYLASLGIDAPPSLNDRLFTMTMQKGAEYMKQTYGLCQSPEEIAAGINAPIAAAYEQELQIKPGMREFLAALHARRIPMAVVTSTDRPLIDAAFARLHLHAYFQKIITCSEFGSGKDRPEIFYAAAEILGSAVSDTWVAEDGLYAARTAKAAGFKVIAVADAASRNDAAALRQLADHYIDPEKQENKSRK